jgi:hypothetical protein
VRRTIGYLIVAGLAFALLQFIVTLIGDGTR